MIRPEGAAQVALLGPPNMGKSTLHLRLTGSDAQVAPYPFTTQFPEPGMLPFVDIQFQLVDLPAIAPWLFERLGVVRVYTKVPGHRAEKSRPFTLRRGQTVADVARLVRRDLVRKLRHARLWGASGFDGQCRARASRCRRQRRRAALVAADPR